MVFGSGDDRGFQDWSGSTRDLDQRLVAAGTPISNWTLHDFRRSLSTSLHEWGTPPNIVEAILGHTGHQVGTPGTSTKRFTWMNAAPLELDVSCGGFDRLPGMVIIELRWAQAA